MNFESEFMLDQTERSEKSLMARRFRGYLPVVVDVETGGFEAETDALLEVAIVTLRFNDEGILAPYQRFSANIHPFDGANLEREALDFTGIDPFDPDREADHELDALTKMFQMIRKEVKYQGCNRAILVGHNAHFDHGFIKAAVARNDIKRDPFHPFSSFDTATLAAFGLGHTVLAKACRLAGMDFDNRAAHSAAYDTEKTAELFCYLINRYKELGGWPLAATDQ